MSAYDEDLLDEEDEMCEPEDLKENAAWKIIQKNTFTRWANEHLKTVNKQLNDLELDLADGLRLIGLVEVLSGKKFKKQNRRPNFRTQKLENVTMVLEFLERDEGIRIVNIDSGDIVDSKLKLILGLIWTLILHYSISMPMWEGEEDQPSEGGPTPKQRLLNWVNSKVPDLPIKNFTTDWNDGKAIGALVDALAPGLCPDWEDWDPKKAAENAKEAMDAAEKWLDVPQLIRPNEITNPKIDDLSMMTYLSQFPKAKLKPGAPLRPRLNAGKVRAYGPGVEPKGNMVNKPANFTVETFSAGKGSLELLVLDPKGQSTQVDQKFNKDQKQTYSCVYTPAMEGEYRVIVKFGEKEIQKSPFKVMVEGAAGDPSKVTAAGPGLEKTGVTVQKKTFFEVFTKGSPPKGKGLPGKLPVGGLDAGKGTVDVSILDPSGHRDKVKPAISQSKKPGVYLVEYTALEIGEHTITITFNGTPIPKCPYHVTVGSAINPKAVYATGRGIQPKGVRVKQNATFKVHTKDAGVAEVKVQIIGPGGANLNCTVKPSKTEEGVYECLYIPPKAGQYVINITFGGQHITKSPFRVDVGPEKTSKVVAFGPGLEGGTVNQPACFTVETNGEVGALGFSIEGPSQAKIDCKDNGDGSADVTYWPTVAGEYAVHILCDDEDIPQSPYMAQIQPATTAFDASKVVAKGPGLEKDGVVVNKPAEFTVDAKKAGKAPLHITCIDATYKAVEVIVKDNKDGTFSCKYTPKSPSRHTIIITWGQVGIPKSPFRVNVSEPVNPGNVKVYGPGVEKGVKTWVVTTFTVDCRSAGPGDVAIALTDCNGKDVPCKTTDNGDGTFTVEYEPRIPGTYTVAVFFAGKEIPKSPIKVKVESSIDLTKVTVKGLEKPIMLAEKRTITVVTINTVKKDAPCSISIKMPSGKTFEMQLEIVSEGYATVFTPTEVGAHTVTITYGGLEVPKSPFTVMVEVAIDVGRVVVKGFETPIPLGETRPVYIVTMGLPKKDAPCKVTVTTPKNKTVELPVKKCPEGYTCDFKPTEKGEHKVEVTYDKKPAPDSPYKVDVVEPKKATVTLKGLEEPIEVAEVRPLTVDTSSMPKKDLPAKVTVTSPKKKTVELPLKKSPDGYTTTFTPKEAGPHKVEVTYDNKPIPDSPFTTDVQPKGTKPAFVVEVLGLDTPIQAGEKRTITVVVKIGNKKAPCKITATNPKGRTSDLKTKPNSEGYETVFTPWDSGIHKIKVEFDSKEVPKSPFEVEVVKINFAAIVVKGLEKPIPLGETRKVSVITKDCGKPDLPCKVTVTSPDGKKKDLPTSKSPEGFDCDFTPEQPGEHTVKVEYSSKEVPKSPFKVNVEVSEITPQKAIKPVEAAPSESAPKKPDSKPSGGDVVVKGLEAPVNPGEKRPVLIDTTNAPKKGAPCKVTTTSPKGRTTEMKTKQVPDGYETMFSSWDKGVHTVTVEYDSKELPDSPFEVIVEKIDVSKVTVKGLDSPIELGETRHVNILTAATGRPDAPCKVTVTTPKGETKEIPVEKVPEEGFDFDFTPTEKGEHKVKITYAGKEVPKSPFPVNVTTIDITGVTVKGLDKPIMVSEKRLIHIITTSTGKKDLPCKVKVTTPKGATMELPTNKREDGHETFFEPTEIGPHKVYVEVAGQEVPKSEFTVQVTKFELKVTVEGLDTPIMAGEKRPIKVNAPAAAKPNRFAPEPTCKITVQNPKGRTFEPKMDKKPDGFETFYQSSEPGPHVFKVEHNGKEIPDSPFTVEVEKMEVRKVDVKGLETPIEVGEVRPIEINTASTGKTHAPCKVTAVGPKGDTTDLPVKETPEGYETTYAPLEVGPHKVKVDYGGREVPKSPYPVDVVPKGKGDKQPKTTVKGLDTPVTVGEKRPVTVTTDKPNEPIKVTQTTPKGQTSEVPTKKTKDGVEATFAPLEEGPYKVKVEQADKEVPGSPFDVEVKPKVDLGKITVKGLETPIPLGEKRPITVDTKSSGKPDAPCKVLAVSPKGVTTELPTKKTPEGYETTFAPLEKGPHMVKVAVDDKPVPKSPFSVDVVPEVDVAKVTISGLEKPVEVNEVRPVKITTKDCGDEDAPIKVTAILPEGREDFLPTKKVPEGYEATFNPKTKGPYKVKVAVAGKEVPKTPVDVEVVDKFNIKKVKVKGLETPIPLGETRPITVDTSTCGKPDAPVQVFAKGPMDKFTELPTKKTPEGVECDFTPTSPGSNEVRVVVQEKDLPDSPFCVKVESPEGAPESPVDETKVEVKGLESPIEVGEARPVTIDTSKTGKPDAPCRVLVVNPKGQTAELPTKKTPVGYETVFKPQEPGPHKVAVVFAEQEVPKSPFPVEVLPKANAGAVKVKGLESPIEVGEPRPILVDATSTGRPDAPCSVMVMNPRGQTAELPLRKVPEGYETVLNPQEPGPHQVSVNFAGQEVPKSPFPVDVLPQPNAGAVKVKGLETPIEVGEPRPILVNTTSTGRPDAPCSVMVMNPRGQTAELPLRKVPEGYETVLNPQEPGPHQVSVNFAGKEVPKSPFPVDVLPKPVVEAVQVKGLEKPIEVGEARPVLVDTTSTGRPDAPCSVMVMNPRGQTAELPLRQVPEGYETVLSPQEPGPHQVAVNFAGKEVPKSPFPVDVQPKANVAAVQVKGLEKPIEVGEARPVLVDTTSTGRPDAPCSVMVMNPRGQTAELPLRQVPEGYETVLSPQEAGPHQVAVNFAGKEVPKSPFPVDVQPKANVGAVSVQGLDTPIEVGEPRPILVDTTRTGRPDAPVNVMVMNPRGQTAELPTRKVPQGYETVLNPLEPGPHQVAVYFAGQEAPRSPFPVDVVPRANVNAVRVRGLERPIEIGEARPITINTQATGRQDAPCRVTMTNPVGQTAEIPVQPSPEGYEAVLAPVEPGPHTVNVEFAEAPVLESPFSVNVTPKPEMNAVLVTGMETPIEVGEARPIQINTIATGKPDAPCRVQVQNPQGQVAELPVQQTPEGYQTVFAPLEAGPHKVDVNFAEKPVPNSPFNVDVKPKVDVSAVEVLGLETPIKVGEPRPVTIMTSTTGKPDAPCKVLVTKPTGVTEELPTRKIPEGYTCTLAPQEEGPHKVDVAFNNKEVPKSPFNVMAETPIDFSKVKVSGLDTPVEVGEIRPIQVETAKCGKPNAPCQVTATNPMGQVRELPLQQTPSGYQAQFAPLEEGPHQVAVKVDGKEVPNSPFNVEAIPQGPASSKVKAYGPGLERGTAEQPCQFTIDTREVTQPGGLGVTVEGPAESKIECRDNQDGTCDVTYYPTMPGDYTINITYADEHIPKSPFVAKVMPSGKFDVSQVKAYGPGLEPGVFLDSPTGFTVDAKSVTPNGDGKVRAIVTSPTGQKTESLVKNNNDGTYDVLYTPITEGPNTIDISYEDHPIPQSPVVVNATPGFDASRVKAYGPGLEGGVTNVEQEFTVDVRGAGKGGLALAIDGPAETKINCIDNRDGTCTVKYMPIKKGDYDITVKFADQNIPGSPFNVKVKDEVNPNKVKCYGPGLEPELVQANQPNTFTVDTREAGEAPLNITSTDAKGNIAPAKITPVEEGVYEATYFPVEEGPCKIDVNYNSQAVPNSPFLMDVKPGINADKVEITGKGVNPTVAASVPQEFTIDTRKAGPSDIVPEPLVQRPDGTVIRPYIVQETEGVYKCMYTPEDCGQYEINCGYAGKPCKPKKVVAVPTGDASKCKITEGLQQTIQVEKQTVITVDACEAGEGKVTCRIRNASGTEIDINITESSDGTFKIEFTPSYPGDYSISIKFGGQSIPDGDYIVQAVDEQQYEEYLKKNPRVGDFPEEELIQAQKQDRVDSAAPGKGIFQPQEFRIPVGPIFSYCTAYIVMPSGKKAYPKIEDNKDGTVTVRYQPCETGTHELHLCYNCQEVNGSPFKFHVDAIDSGYVTAYGPGLSHGTVNVPCEFTIVTKDAGAGGLSLAIEGPSKTEIKCKDNGDGTCTVSYVPTAPGEYNITVKFADKDISGSPFCAKITPGEPKQKAMIGRSSEVSLKITETDITNLTASIRSPSGQEEPCMLKRLPNGHLGISFTPRETGEHLVNVFRDGQHIPNSPFTITVGETELGNAGKVKVHGKGLTEGMANEVNEFIVDTREAGYGGLSLSIEGPSKADIECHDNEDGTCRVTYKPTEPGTYIINIKFADEHVPGSPFKVKIGGDASERITERIMRHRDAVDVSHVGSECELSLKIPGTTPFDMTASVTSPSGVTELCDVVNLDDSHYSIKFVPKEMGIHTVSVKHKDMHIPGSPFQFTVGPIAGGGAHKVHAAGMGLVKGEVEQPNEFNIYTREAGAGGLSIAVEGPSKAEVDFQDRKDGSCGVTYNVAEAGEYLVSIKFNDEHIPESPFRVPISPSIGDARKVSVSALQNKGLTIGKPAAFMVNFNGASKGKLQARVVSPSGAEDAALIQEIDDGEYAVRFIPYENGPHLVYVSFDGCQIPDSPFRVQVGTVHADPGLVQAYGDGLKQGKTGQTAKFIVNTCNAGSGALAVTVEGPSKVKLECREVDEGYEFSYNPTAPGDYLITIKYAGLNIAGSPYKARIEGQGQPSGYQEQASVVVETVTKTSVMSKFTSLPPFDSDASKVTVEGNGLKKGYRNKQCSFNVDTSKAGMNMLFIGMIGPKGPCEELTVKNVPGNPYKISYLVKERGDYMLAIKWGEEHISGSPFHVRVD